MDSRLKTLIDSDTKRGNPPNADQVAEWRYKLENKIWIEGTPWNIPASHWPAITDHFEECVKKGSGNVVH